MEKWRLLDLETPNQAAMNLAIEEAFFITRIEAKVPPTVRFWRNRSAVVVGYSQSVEAEVNLEVCRDRGIQVLRRFSGGGAVYHDLGNLNCSIAVEADHPLLKGLDIIDSYSVLCSGIIEGLKSLGIALAFDPPSDLLVGTKKVSGNAQSRKKGVVFHHGTLLVSTDLNLLTKVLNVPDESQRARKVDVKKKSVTNLADEIGCQLQIQRVKEALQQGFEKSFSVILEKSGLTPEERRIAQDLFSQKYSRNEWNFWR